MRDHGSPEDWIRGILHPRGEESIVVRGRQDAAKVVKDGMSCCRVGATDRAHSADEGRQELFQDTRGILSGNPTYES